MRCVVRVAARNAQIDKVVSTHLASALSVGASAIGSIYLKIEFWNGNEMAKKREKMNPREKWV